MSRDDRSADHELSELGRQVSDASRASDLHDFDAGAARFDRAVNGVAEVAGIAIFATILGLVFVNAAGRYALGLTFIWGDELVIALLPWLGMLGMFLAIRRRQVIRIDFFVGLFPLRVAAFLHLASSVVAAGAFLYLAIVSYEWTTIFGGDRTIYLRIEKGWFMAALVIGPALAAAAYLVVTIGDLRRRRAGGGEA